MTTDIQTCNPPLPIKPNALTSNLISPLRPWRGIILHHSDLPHRPIWGIDYAHRFHHFHTRVRNWQGGLGYHFLLTWDPQKPARTICWASCRWKLQMDGAHTAMRPEVSPALPVLFPNRETIGFCIVGNFDHQPLPPSLAAVTAFWINRLCALLHLDPYRHFYLHRNFSTKSCPGLQISRTTILQHLPAMIDNSQTSP